MNIQAVNFGKVNRGDLIAITGLTPVPEIKAFHAALADIAGHDEFVILHLPDHEIAKATARDIYEWVKDHLEDEV